MNPARSNTILLWCGLVLYLMTAVMPSSGLVLCFGPEGTVALETGRHMSCDGCDHSACDNDHPSDTSSSVRGPCCLCFDVPLGLGHDGPQIRSASVSLELSAPMVPSHSVEVVVSSEVGIGENRRVWPPPQLATTLSHIKTVILRV